MNSNNKLPWLSRKRALNLPQNLCTKLYHHQLNPSASSRPIYRWFLFSFHGGTLSRVFLCWTVRREARHVSPARLRPSACHDRGSKFEREGARMKSNVVARSGIRTARRAARDSARDLLATRSDRSLLHSPPSVRALEINQHPREKRRKCCRREFAKILSIGYHSLIWVSKESFFHRKSRGEIMKVFVDFWELFFICFLD